MIVFYTNQPGYNEPRLWQRNLAEFDCFLSNFIMKKKGEFYTPALKDFKQNLLFYYRVVDFDYFTPGVNPIK